MIQVNPFHLHRLVSSLAGLANDDEMVETYRYVNPDNELQMKEVIAHWIKPDFEQSSERAKEGMKLSLQYYLSKTNSDFSRIYDSNLLPFSSPNDTRLFFLWIWQVLFPNENHQLASLQNFVEVSDIHAVNL